MAAATVLAVASHGLFRWVAIAALLGAAPPAVASLRALVGPVDPRWHRALPSGLLVGVTAWMLWPLVTGEPPASRDHAIHYFQARILVDEMLPTGRLSGWTERFNHGFPFGEGYPTLGVLWVSAAHLLSFGAVGLRHSYAWGLLGVWALTLWGVWHLAAAVGTDLRARVDPGASSDDLAARWAGCAGAFAWLLDPGAARQGGWNYLMFHGVWPQQLSTALWIAALVWMLRALRGPSPRRLSIAAILLAGSLLAHPFGLLTAAASATGLIIVALVAPDARRWASGRLRILAIIHALGIALAVAGMATFLAAAGELGRSPVAWAELGELAARLTTGDLLAGGWTWTGTFVVVGVGLALWSGRAVAWLCAGLCCGLLLLGSRDSITVLRLDLLASGFKNMQFPRFAIALKPVAYAAAGAALVFAAGAIGSRVRQAALPHGPRRRIFVAIVLAPGIAAMLGRSDMFAHRPVASIDTLAASELAGVEQSLHAALADEARNTPAMRVAFLREGMGGGTYPMFAIADVGAAAVLDGHVATVNFDRLVDRRSPAVFDRLGVTHVVWDRTLGEYDAELAALLEQLGTHGSYALARYVGQLDTGPRFVVGTGVVTEVEHTPEARAYDVVTGRGGTIEVAMAPSARWQWALDGEPLASTTTSVRGGVELLAVDVPHGGHLTLSYVTGVTERAARWVSVVAAILALWMLVGARPLQLAERLHAPVVQRITRVSLAIAGLLVLGLLARRQHAQLGVTWHEFADHRYFTREPEPPAFIDDLTSEGDVEVTRADRPVCDGVLGKDALVDCEEGDYRVNPSFAYVDPYLYRCTSIGIAAGDTATIRLGDPGDRVVAFVLRRGKDGRGRHLRFATGHALQVLGNRRADLHFEPHKYPDGAVLTIENAGADPELVCVGAARFE